MENAFDEYQADLIVKFVEAARRGPKEKREFVYYCQSPDPAPLFREGFRESLRVDKSDLDALAAMGLITNSQTIPDFGHISLQQKAFDVCDKWKNQPPPHPPRPIGF